MKFSTSTLVLATLAAGQATAVSIAHQHAPKHNHAQRHAEIMKAANEKRDLAKRNLDLLGATDIDKVLGLGLKAVGVNPTSAVVGAPWIGTDGAFTNEFINQSKEDLILVCWGPAGSWVNAIVPQITTSIPAGQSQTLSFPSGASGACTAIYPDSKLVNGQISETWLEHTYGPWGVVDVSREVNMAGHNITTVGPQCVTDMSTCVFVCPEGQNTCMTGYELLNCQPGTQAGANYGTYFGSPSGGCGGMGEGAALKTYLG